MVKPALFDLGGHRPLATAGANSSQHNRVISSTEHRIFKIQRELMPQFRVLRGSQASSRYRYNVGRLF